MMFYWRVELSENGSYDYKKKKKKTFLCATSPLLSPHTHVHTYTQWKSNDGKTELSASGC